MTNKIFHVACLIYNCEREEIESTKRTVNLAMARYLMFALLTDAGVKATKVIECLRRDRVMAYHMSQRVADLRQVDKDFIKAYDKAKTILSLVQ